MEIKQFLASAKLLGFTSKSDLQNGYICYVLKKEYFRIEHGFIRYGKARIHYTNESGIQHLFEAMLNRLDHV